MKEKLKLYLSHTIMIRREVREWELRAENNYNIDLINPFYDLGKSENVEALDSGKSTDPYFNITKELATEIVNRDLEAISNCDGLISYMKYPSIGSVMEIYHTKQLLMKPVYIYLEDKRYLKHPWLMYFSDNIYTTIDSLNRKLRSLIVET